MICPCEKKGETSVVDSRPTEDGTAIRRRRLCSCGEMEDEIHFLLHCHHYTHVRQKYFDPDTPLSIMLDNHNTPQYIQELNQLRKLYKK